MTTDLLTPPIVDDATRREVLAGGLALGLGFGLSACGRDNEPAAGPTTRTIETPLRPVDVPVQARRVVALDYFQGIAHDLGVPLVARSGYVEPWKEDDADYRGLPAAEVEGVADVEAIAVLRPDLIMGIPFAIDPVREELQRFAPILEIPDEFSADWRGMHLLIADAAGLPSPAALLEGVDERTRAIGARLPAGVRSAAIIRANDVGMFRVYAPDSFSGELVTGAGLDVLRLGENVSSTDVSLERLGEVQSDVIFLWVSELSDPSIVTESGLWSQLPAVQAGRVVEVGPHWIGSDLEAVGLLLDDLERALA